MKNPYAKNAVVSKKRPRAHVKNNDDTTRTVLPLDEAIHSSHLSSSTMTTATRSTVGITSDPCTELSSQHPTRVARPTTTAASTSSTRGRAVIHNPYAKPAPRTTSIPRAEHSLSRSNATRAADGNQCVSGAAESELATAMLAERSNLSTISSASLPSGQMATELPSPESSIAHSESQTARVRTDACSQPHVLRASVASFSTLPQRSSSPVSTVTARLACGVPPAPHTRSAGALPLPPSWDTRQLPSSLSCQSNQATVGSQAHRKSTAACETSSAGQGLATPQSFKLPTNAEKNNSVRPYSSIGGPSTTRSVSSADNSRPTFACGPPRPHLSDPNGLPPPLHYSEETVQPPNDEYRKTLIKHARLSEPLDNGWTLFSHQKKAILKGLLMRRMILALDMGLGKTLIGCVWARAFRNTYGASKLKILVICPTSLKSEWKRTAEKATGLPVVEEKDPEETMGLQICSWAKVPKSVSSEAAAYVVIMDEAHSIQSMESARTGAALTLVGRSRCVGVLMLTGTPMKNGKPLNLFPLLKAVRHPFGNQQKAYETHFCAGREKSFGGRVVWDANGSTNLTQLREHVSSHVLHMTKEQCLKDLPPKTRVTRQVPVSSRHQLQHDQALTDLARLYASSGSLENSGELVLTAVQRVRQIGSFAKVASTVGLAKEVLQEQPAVVIFSSFAQVAKQVHRMLSESGWDGELLTGETPQKKRPGMVDKFQAGLSPVFVCTFGAGGVGLTLTAACTIILLDRPWTPGEAEQAEDRIRRIGQTKPVTSIFMVAFDLDKQIDGLIQQKKQTTSAVLVGGEQEKQTFDAPKISVFQLLRSLLGNKEHGSTRTNSMGEAVFGS